MKEEGRLVVGGGDLDGEGGKSVQLLLTGRLSVKQWDLWGRGGGVSKVLESDMHIIVEP